jgi:hypothetical protein
MEATAQALSDRRRRVAELIAAASIELSPRNKLAGDG